MIERVATGPDQKQDDRFAEFARTRDPILRDGLISANLGLAHQLARRFGNRGEPHDDLVQVASLALVKAVDRFDPDRGATFSSFAVTSIVGELKRHFRDRGWAVRAPRRIQELYLELGHHIDQLSQQLGRAPTIAELAAAAGSTEEAVLEALEAGRGYRSASLDAPDRDEKTLAESLGGDDPQFTHIEDRSVLVVALKRLSPRDRRILQLRFVDGLTQSEIAAKLGVSQMQISRLLAASLQSLRTSFESQAPESESPPDT